MLLLHNYNSYYKYILIKDNDEKNNFHTYIYNTFILNK